LNERTKEKERKEKKSFIIIIIIIHTVFSNTARMSSKSDLTVQQTIRKLCTREKKRR
jgi:hypothetical protein